MADEEILRRIDAHLERSGELFARNEEALERHREAFERNREAFERNLEASARNEQAFERNEQAFERCMQAMDRFEASHQDLRTFIRDITRRSERVFEGQMRGFETFIEEVRDEMRAQRAVLFRVLDRLDADGNGSSA